MLRAAEPQDAAQMAAILSGWIDETPWMPRIHTLAEDRGFVEGIVSKSTVWAAHDVQGFLTQDKDEIDCLYIGTSFRGAGLGRALLNAAKEKSPAMRLWTFAANEGAQRFYAREGFTQIAHTDGAGNDEKLPDVRLEWRKENAA